MIIQKRRETHIEALGRRDWGWGGDACYTRQNIHERLHLSRKTSNSTKKQNNKLNDKIHAVNSNEETRKSCRNKISNLVNHL